MKLLNILNSSLIVEVADKVKKQLLSKFKLQTQDEDTKILEYIDEFDVIKNVLDATKRDITKYDYKTIVELVDYTKNLKNRKNDFKTTLNKFLVRTAIEKPGLLEARVAVKKFLEIQSQLTKKYNNIEKYSYLELTNFLNKYYSDFIKEKLLSKFQTENTTLNNAQILYYIETYIEFFNELSEEPSADLITFSQLEAMIDSLLASKGLDKKAIEDTKNIDKVYEKDGLTIFSPKTKAQCIKLANGRTWCTSKLGASNLYYFYRFTKGRTLYYVVDESKDFEDRFYATVILVDGNGGTAFADKTNNGRFGGSDNMPWSEISGYVPRLENLKNLFVSRPLSDDEIDMRNKYEDKNYSSSRYNPRKLPNGATPMEYFGNPQAVAMWMEFNSPELFDEDYASLTPDLMKKYISLGFELNKSMINSSPKEVLEYYAQKKIEKIKNSTIESLSDSDIALLKTPYFKDIKEELKPKFAKQLAGQGRDSKGSKSLEINNFNSGIVGKFVNLYGLEQVLASADPDITDLNISGDGSNLELVIDENILRFKKLELLALENGVLNEIPLIFCKLPTINILSFQNNPNITSVPECLGKLNPTVINLTKTGVKEFPKWLTENYTDFSETGIWSEN